MPRLILALSARADLVRLREFLQPKNPAAAKRTAEAIKRQLQILIQQPGIGRPVLDLTDKPFNRTSRSIDLSNRLRTPSEPWIFCPCGRFSMKKRRKHNP